MGALNAYSLAIKINKKIPALFSNRAACHLKLNHLPKAVKDASQVWKFFISGFIFKLLMVYLFKIVYYLSLI